MGITLVDTTHGVCSSWSYSYKEFTYHLPQNVHAAITKYQHVLQLFVNLLSYCRLSRMLYDKVIVDYQECCMTKLLQCTGCLTLSH